MRNALLLFAVFLVPLVAPVGAVVGAWLQPLVGALSLPTLHPDLRAYLEDVWTWYKRLTTFVGAAAFAISAVVGVGLLSKTFWRRA